MGIPSMTRRSVWHCQIVKKFKKNNNLLVCRWKLHAQFFSCFWDDIIIGCFKISWLSKYTVYLYRVYKIKYDSLKWVANVILWSYFFNNVVKTFVLRNTYFKRSLLACLFIHVSVCLSVCLPICFSISLPLCMFVYLSVYLAVCLSIELSPVYLFV